MMKLFAFLFRRAPTIESIAPPVFIDGVKLIPSSSTTLERTDLLEQTALALAVTPFASAKEESARFVPEVIDLENMFCVIEYIDAKGEKTRRRITMSSLHNGPTGLIVHAICHERKAIRHFRVDRIFSVISAEGEVLQTRDFFSDLLGIEIAIAQQTSKDHSHAGQPLKLLTARDLRERLRAPLSILVCAAIADHELHIEEIDRIQIYAESEIFALHKEGRISETPTLEVMDQLCKMISGMRPQRRSMRGYIEKVCEWPEHRVRRLTKALGQVIVADGKIVPEEYAFMDEMNAFAKASREERFGMLAATGPDFFEEGV